MKLLIKIICLQSKDCIPNRETRVSRNIQEALGDSGKGKLSLRKKPSVEPGSERGGHLPWRQDLMHTVEESQQLIISNN